MTTDTTLNPAAADIIKLGGIATAQVPDSAVAQAIVYSSPALPERSVVRLAPAPLAVVEDLTAEAFGLSPAGATEVGFMRARASGFPAWPIMHDPGNARHALNLVGALQRAGRQLRSKPGAAKDELTKIGNDLGNAAPHFLPTFYEEAARMFLAAGNQTYAAQFVGKAREAERVHGLAIDEQRHQAVMLEFALEGAVSAKELTAEAKSLPGRVAPDEAYELFLRLNVERVLGGMPPYAGVLVDLRKLGRAAGKKPAETDHDFLGQVISAQSLRQAAGAFWERATPALKKLVETDEAVASGLVSFLPGKVKVAAWVAILSELRLLDQLAADPPAARSWLQMMMDQVVTRWDDGDSESLVPVILGWQQSLAGATFSCSGRLALDTMDALLEVGAEVELRGGGLDLRLWARNFFRRDLTFVAAHPRLRAAFSAPSWIPDDLPSVAAAHPGAREIVRGWLQTARDQGGLTLVGLERRLEFARWATAETYPAWHAEFDALYSGLDVPEIVAENLRLGLTTELTHPLVEQTITELKAAGTKNDRWPTVADQWPAIAVYCDNRVRFIEGAEIVAAHDFPADVDIEAAELVAGEIGIMVMDASYDSVRMWAGPTATQKLVGYYRAGAESSLPVPGGRLYPSGLVTPGGKAYHNTQHNGEVLSDGTHYWRLHLDDCVELDPETGREGRQSLPAALAAAVEQHRPEGFALSTGTMYRPVTPATADSLMSTADGMHSCIVLVQPQLYGTPAEQRIIDADGTLYTWTPPGRSFASPVWGVLRRPGGGVWLVDADRTLIDAETGLYLLPALTADADNHLLTQLPRHVWHHLRARDEGASERMRGLIATDVEALVEAVSGVPEPADIPRQTFWEPAYVYDVALPGSSAMATAAALLGVDAADTRMHPLLTSVVMVAVDALQSVRAAAEITGRAGGDPAADEVVDVPALNKVVAAHRPQYSRGSLQRVIQAIDDGSVPDENLDVAQIIGWESALVALAAAPLRPAEERTQLARLGVDLGEVGFLTPGMGTAVVPQLTSGTAGAWFTTRADGGHRLLRIAASYDYSVVLFAGEAPATVHDLPVTVASGERPDPDALLGVLLHLRDTDATLEWDPGWATALAAATGLSEAAAAILLMGLPRLGEYVQNFLPADVRTLLGLKVAEADMARTELRALPIQHLIALLAAAVPLSDPASYLTAGPDIAAMANMWRKLRGDRLTLPADVVADVTKTFHEWGADKVPELLQEVPDARTFADSRAHLQPAFLAAMAERLPLDDPLRAWLADRLEQLAAAFVATPQVEAAYSYSAQVLAALSLPEPQDRTVAERHEVDGLVLVCQYGRVEIFYSPAEAQKQPELLPRLEGLPVDNAGALRRTVRLHEFLTGDAVAETVAWLRTPGSGSPRDPQAVVPGVVEQAAAGLGVPAEAARYWLQLAALPNPSDRVVQAATGWTKAARTAAAAPLLEQGLVIEAKRPRAGRTLFLPGGWLEASAPHPPMEVWKAPFFDLDDTPKVSPLFGAVVYVGPMSTLFTDAWQRYADGDAPGYQELRTQPYRRRRRR